MNPETLVISNPDCAGHDTGPHHRENARRLATLLAAVDHLLPEADGRVRRAEGRHAEHDDLALVHPAYHIALIEEAARTAEAARSILFIDADTALTEIV